MAKFNRTLKPAVVCRIWDWQVERCFAERPKGNPVCIGFRQHLTIWIRKTPNAVPKISLFHLLEWKDNGRGFPRVFFLSVSFFPLIRQKFASSVLFLSILTRDKLYLSATGLSMQAFVFCFAWGEKTPQHCSRAINFFWDWLTHQVVMRCKAREPAHHIPRSWSWTGWAQH